MEDPAININVVNLQNLFLILYEYKQWLIQFDYYT